MGWIDYKAINEMALQKRREIRRNLNAVVEALPRWGRRVSEQDRDMLIQALADLELYHNTVGEFSHDEKVRAAAAEFLGHDINTARPS